MKRYPEKVKQEAIRLRLESRTKWTIPALSKRLGVSQRTLSYWFQQAEEEEPKYAGRLTNGNRRRFNRKKILRDLKARKANGRPKYTRREIAEKYNCSPKFLSNLATGKIEP